MTPHPYDAQRAYASRAPGPSSHPPPPPGYVQVDPRWQTSQSTERASVRLAARNTSQPQTQQMIPIQYPQYFPSGGIALIPYPAQYVQQSHKRAPEQEEEVAAPKKKPRTVRTKADGTPGLFSFLENLVLFNHQFSVAKRGYTAKKRNEAAQIAAQNGTSGSTYLCLLGSMMLSPNDDHCIIRLTWNRTDCSYSHEWRS